MFALSVRCSSWQDQFNAGDKEDLGDWFADTLSNAQGLGRRISFVPPGIQDEFRLIEDLRVFPWKDFYYSFFFRYPANEPEWQTEYEAWIRSCLFFDPKERP